MALRSLLPVVIEGLEPRLLLSASFAASEYFPLAVGNQWSYAGQRDGQPLEALMSASGQAQVLGKATTRFDFDVLGSTEAQSTFMALDPAAFHVAGQVISGDTGTWSDSFGSTMWFPASMDSGGRHNYMVTVNAVATSGADAGKTASGLNWGQLRVFDLETVTTPAGVFTALRLELESEWSRRGDGWTANGSADATLWVVSGVGLVKYEASERSWHSDSGTVESDISYALTGSTLAFGKAIADYSLYFDEAFYLQQYPDVAAGVADGVHASGWDHFENYGFGEGRDPSAYFSNGWYLQQNPDVAASVGEGLFLNGYDHFVRYGAAEGRSASAGFDEIYYRKNNPDVTISLLSGKFHSGLQHFMYHGQAEGRSPMALGSPVQEAQLLSRIFDEAFYLASNPDVAADVGTVWQSGFDHYCRFGHIEGRDPNAYFSENYYRSLHVDVTAAIGVLFKSAADHYIQFGASEGRKPSTEFNEAFYLANNPDVADAVGTVWMSGLEHFLACGKAEGRAPKA